MTWKRVIIVKLVIIASYPMFFATAVWDGMAGGAVEFRHQFRVGMNEGRYVRTRLRRTVKTGHRGDAA